MSEAKEVGYYICMACGNKYGKYSVGCSSVWHGKCDYCGKYTTITESRDYGYPLLPKKGTK